MALKNVVIGQTTYNGVDNIKVKDTSNNDVYFVETSDATALESEIKSGETAYVNGEKITGTLVEKTLTEKHILANGEYLASSDSADGYSKVVVNVSSTINNQDKTIVSNGEYTADSEYTGLGTVTVNVPSTVNNQNKTVTPTTSQQSVNADNGYSGLGTVTVNAVTSAIDNNITAGNIKKDVTILGVTGTLETGSTINNQDKTVTSNGTVTADAGYTGLGTVTVNVPQGGGSVTKGLEFSNYDENGYPTTATFVGMTSIPSGYCSVLFRTDLFGKNINILTIPEGVTSIGANSFVSCNALKTINLPNTLTTVGNNAFKESGLTSFPNNWKVTTIPQSCFSLCPLSTINIPEGVTTIEQVAFQACSSATSISLPTTLTTLSGIYNFHRCAEVTSVEFRGQAPNIPEHCFDSCSKVALYDFTNCTTIPTLADTTLGHASGCIIKVPASLGTTWKTSTNWSALTNVVWQDENGNVIE